MLEKPRLEDEKIITCLKQSYGLSVTSLEFLPIGHDSYAGVYRVQADGQAYFLKVKSDTVDPLSVSIPRYLSGHGLEQAVAPLPTITQELWGRVEHFTLILYPFIEGQVGMRVGLSDTQWREFGAALKRLHTIRLPPDLSKRVPEEPFVPHPRWSAVVSQLQHSIEQESYDDPIEQEFARFWKAKRQEIGRIVERTEQLGQILRSKPPPFVLCHADIHTANLLLDAHNEVFIVDWDQPILAPKERDLMFVIVGGFVSSHREESLFFEGYGKTDVDRQALAYYRYARAVEDAGALAEEAIFMDVGDETKQNALKGLMSMFEPGRLVEAAHKLDHEW